MCTVLIKALLVTGPRDLQVLKKISWSAVTSQSGVILVNITPHGKRVTQICKLKLVNLAQAIQESRTSQKYCRISPPTRQFTTTHKFVNTGSNHKTRDVPSFPTHYTTEIWLAQISTAFEASLRTVGKGLGVLTGLLTDCLRVRHSNWYDKGIVAVASRWHKAVRSWWRLCTKMRCVVHPYSYPVCKQYRVSNLHAQILFYLYAFLSNKRPSSGDVQCWLLSSIWLLHLISLH